MARGKESPHTSSKIKSLKGYQKILELGVDDTSTALLGKKGTVRFESEPVLGYWTSKSKISSYGNPRGEKEFSKRCVTPTGIRISGVLKPQTH